ncbi:MAG: DNA repair protein RecN [Acholeplasmataceae bacterium]|nr:DNA repair protein RecN [Acholeplasmataceae bacterium]
MIKALRVQNFALIDDLDMTFETGLSALTGETGAGKSIILESLNLLFGKRSDAQMIRHGSTKASVFGIFELNDLQMDVLGLPKIIEIEREIDGNGRHQMKLNHENVTLSKLRDVMTSIGSIHSQNETMTLFDKQAYVDFIDQMNHTETEKLRNAYLFARESFLSLDEKDKNLRAKKAESLEKAEFYEFQIQELKSLKLVAGEKKDILDKIEKMKHHDRILQSLREANQIFSEDVLSIDLIYQASKTLDKITYLDANYLSLQERLTNAYYELDDVKSLLFQALEDLDFDEDSFNSLQERSYELDKIESKYHKSVEELIDYLNEIEEAYRLITDYDNLLEESKKAVNQAFLVAIQQGEKLSTLRKKLAKEFEKEMLNQLKDLDLDKAIFEVLFEKQDITPSILTEQGIDSIEFMISLNEGEPIKPLARVASGGERARFMFSLKAIDAIRNRLSLLILDEIDIGISGKTAAKVARKMKELSNNMQLIVITHLPQVAARADHHYEITKIKEDDRMVTRINHLDVNRRIESIALMLSDEKLSTYAIEQAKMLLEK